LPIKDDPPMPSLALIRWRTDRLLALDEIEAAHRSVGGAGPGRRSTTQQLNQAYAVLLSSQFQGYCRDLHTECARAVARALLSPDLQTLMTDTLLLRRSLDIGNPNPGNIGADFERFGLSFRPVVDSAHGRNRRRKLLLEQLNRWRNAIAHNAFEPSMLRSGRPVLSLAQVRRWRKACDGLARWFDRVMRERLQALLGASPW
jgi:hypothetical protein